MTWPIIWVPFVLFPQSLETIGNGIEKADLIPMHDRAHKEGCVYPQPLVFTLLGHKRDFPSHLAIKDNARIVKFLRKEAYDV